MFGCIYFYEDASLSVVNDTDETLTIDDEFVVGKTVSMKWGPKHFNGTIIKVSDDENCLTTFANKAQKKILSKLETIPDAPPPELFSFDPNATKTGRRTVKLTERARESREQEEPVVKKVKTKKTSTDPNNLNARDIINGLEKQSNSVPLEPSTDPNNPIECNRADISGHRNDPIRNNLFDALADRTVPIETNPSDVRAERYDPIENTRKEPNLSLATETNLSLNCFESPVSNSSERTKHTDKIIKTVVSSTPKVPDTQVASDHNNNSSFSTSAIVGDSWKILHDDPPTSPLDVTSCEITHIPPEVVEAFRILTTHKAQSYMRNVVLRSEEGRSYYVNDSSQTGQTSYLGLLQGSDVTRNPPVNMQHPSPSEVTPFAEKTVVTPKNICKFSPLRRSPRLKGLTPTQKKADCSRKLQLNEAEMVSIPANKNPKETIRLLSSCDIEVNASKLRTIIRRARTDSNPGVYVARKLLVELFSMDELAQSRGQGIGRGRKGDDIRPVLCPEKIQVMKGYSHAWCNGQGFKPPSEKDLNSAITEGVSYARRKMRTIGKEKV